MRMTRDGGGALQVRSQDLADSAAHAVKAGFVAVALAVWNRFQPPRQQRCPVPSPSDSLQRTMNLVMPLRRSTVFDRGELLGSLVRSTDKILVALSNVGTVHFARFLLVDRNLCMISVYDGDLRGYIRDFLGTLGDVFDGLMAFVEDPPPRPVVEFPDEFIAWVDAHDAFQFPDESTDLLPELNALERESLLVLRRHRNIQLGTYRCYPGHSAAQVRHGLGIGW